MRKLILMFLVAVLLSVFYTACSIVDVTPAPEVEIIRFHPLAVYVTPPDTAIDTTMVIDTTVVPHDTTMFIDTVLTLPTVEIDSIIFRVGNYVDAIIQEMTVDYRSVRDGDTIASNYRAGFGIQLSGGDEWCEESQITTVVGIQIDATNAVIYMYGNNDNTVADITFSGEDAFGNEREFSCSMHFGLMQMPETFLSDRKKRRLIPIIE